MVWLFSACLRRVTLTSEIGVLKTYKLTYESTDVVHAIFDKKAALNNWRISARLLKDFIEHFAPKTEQLDIGVENNRVTFMSYTEKVSNGQEVLKQPLQTVIAIDMLEFETISVAENHHIAISVKDFKAIVTHAETLNASVSAHYSRPTRPLQMSYGVEGMLCEFTLMTVRDFRDGVPTPSGSGARTLSGVLARQATPTGAGSVGPTSTRADSRAVSISGNMAPPPMRASTVGAQEDESRPSTQTRRRPSPPPPRPSMDPHSLFFSDHEADNDGDGDDDDFNEIWGNEADEMIAWDVSLEPASMTASKAQDLYAKAKDPEGEKGEKDEARGRKRRREEEESDKDKVVDERFAPTQHISQIRGIFD
jgi:cell cycle checkpoint control protein RAD9A